VWQPRFGVQSELPLGNVHPPTEELFHNNSYAHDNEGDNPGREIQGSTVSAADILISGVKVLAALTWSEANRCG